MITLDNLEKAIASTFNNILQNFIEENINFKYTDKDYFDEDDLNYNAIIYNISLDGTNVTVPLKLVLNFTLVNVIYKNIIKENVDLDSEINDEKLTAIIDIIGGILKDMSQEFESQLNTNIVVSNSGSTIVNISDIKKDENFAIVEFDADIESKKSKFFIYYNIDEFNHFLTEIKINDFTGTNELSNIENLSMILDVELHLRVRIGHKKMLLKDIVDMDIGTVIELNQLSDEPLDIMIDDLVIGKGTVVIVDGNFGVQIVEIGTNNEILKGLNYVGK